MAQPGSWSQCPSCQFQFFTPNAGVTSATAPGQLPPAPTGNATAAATVGETVPSSQPAGASAVSSEGVVAPTSNPSLSVGMPGSLNPLPVLSQLPVQTGLPRPVPPTGLPMPGGLAPLRPPPNPVLPTPVPPAPAAGARTASAPMIPPVRGDGDMSSAMEAMEARRKQAAEEAARQHKKALESAAKGEVQAGPSLRRPDPIEEKPAKVSHNPSTPDRFRSLAASRIIDFFFCVMQRGRCRNSSVTTRRRLRRRKGSTSRP